MSQLGKVVIAMQESGLDGRHRDRNGKIDSKRSDAQNGNLSKPIPGFRSDATVGRMRQVTGQQSLAAIRQAAKNLKRG
jgi:hypothetical protein